MISFFTKLVIFIHERNDLFLITGSETKVSKKFSHWVLYVVLAQAFPPYNESPRFAFIVFFQFGIIRELLTWSSYSITSKVPSPATPHHLMSQVSLLFGTN